MSPIDTKNMKLCEKHHGIVLFYSTTKHQECPLCVVEALGKSLVKPDKEEGEQ